MPPDGSQPDRAAQKYAFLVNGLIYRSADPTLTGRTLREIARLNPASDYVVVQVKHPGASSVGLDDPVDLTEDGKEEFLAWPSDRIFTFTIDEVAYEWGTAEISGAELRDISGAPEDEAFVLEREGEPDRAIGQDDIVDLGKRGVEHIRTKLLTKTIYINTVPRQVQARRLSYDDLVRLAFPTRPSGPNILITVEYGNGPREEPVGSVKPGESVKIVNGMEFDVIATDRS